MSMLKNRSPWLLGIAIAIACGVAVACSEATDGLVPPGAGFDGGVGLPSSSSGEAGTSSGGGTSGGAANPGKTTSQGVILLNEVSGDDWVEIINAGDATIDLSGWTVADGDKTTGLPKVEEGATFPDGTKLEASAYGMVIGGGIDAGIECPSGGQRFCFNAEFGISKNGETIFLLASDGGVIGSVAYPADASVSDHTWSRRPNGDPDGEFVVTEATPGSPNK